MQQKYDRLKLTDITGLLRKMGITAFFLAAFIVPTLAQDDDVELVGKVVDAGNRQIGKAELIQSSGVEVRIMFGYNIKLWLDGGSKLRIVRPLSGSRSTTITCSFREYKVDPKNPKDSSKWNETGSGTATLQMTASGEVQKITTTMTLTHRVVGEDEVAVTEKPQKVTIIFD